MLRLASQLKELPVYSLRDGAQVAKIEELIIDPLNGRFLAAVTAKGGMMRKVRIIAAQDIREVTPEVAVVDSHDVVTGPDEIIRVSELVRGRYELEGRQVVTESGQALGSVGDFEIELSTGALLRLHVRSRMLAKETLVDIHDIIRIEPKQVIVRDLLIKSGQKSESVSRAVKSPAPTVSASRLSQR
jgi:uncharacterized protein YrrD